MNWLDVLIILILVCGAWRGYLSGLFRQIFGLIGIILGLYLGSLYSVPTAKLLAPYMGSCHGAGEIVAFLIICLLVFWGLSLLAVLLTKFFDWIQLGVVNRIIGACLGIVKYAFFISCLLNIWVYIQPDSMAFRDESVAYRPLLKPASIAYEECKDHAVKQMRLIVEEYEDSSILNLGK